MIGNTTKWVVMAMVLLTATSAFAAAGEGGSNLADVAKWAFAAASIGLGIAAFGGALGQGRALASAMEGIGRNPESAGKMFVPMLLGLVFIESLVIYALVIGFGVSGGANTALEALIGH